MRRRHRPQNIATAGCPWSGHCVCVVGSGRGAAARLVRQVPVATARTLARPRVGLLQHPLNGVHDVNAYARARCDAAEQWRWQAMPWRCTDSEGGQAVRDGPPQLRCREQGMRVTFFSRLPALRMTARLRTGGVAARALVRWAARPEPASRSVSPFAAPGIPLLRPPPPLPLPVPVPGSHLCPTHPPTQPPAQQSWRLARASRPPSSARARPPHEMLPNRYSPGPLVAARSYNPGSSWSASGGQASAQTSALLRPLTQQLSTSCSNRSTAAARAS